MVSIYRERVAVDLLDTVGDYDGPTTQHVVPISAAAQASWERICATKGWPVSATIFMRTWAAWYELKARGTFPGTYEDFEARASAVCLAHADGTPVLTDENVHDVMAQVVRGDLDPADLAPQLDEAGPTKGERD